MENDNLAKKVKDLRMRQGYSQEELAEKSQLSLRTIQRIENGETEPSGHTLKSLAAALKVTPDDLVDWTQQEDKGFLSILNLSALAFIVFPLLGVIVPLALWILKRDKIRHVNESGKKIVNFQITWSILLFLAYALMIVPIFFRFQMSDNLVFPYFNPFYLMATLVGLYAYNFLMVIINTIRSQKEKMPVYQPAIPFLR